MITASQAAVLCQQIYDPVPPGIFSPLLSIGGIVVGLVIRDMEVCVVFPGSEKEGDWVIDAEAVPYAHPQLGMLHAGFWSGMQDVFYQLQPFMRGKVVTLAGHSLGCAHASILAGLCAVAGLPIAQMFLFAPPRPGYQSLRSIVTAHVGQIAAFHNRGDIVPSLPLSLPFFPWCDIAPLIEIDDHSSIDPHAIANYVAAALK